MKTSASQFELMISFMEEHGDLTKPSTDASGRLRTMRNWERLSDLLNSDGGGDTKTIDKWKKVWGDFKNNTKKKAARLHKQATGTGGGPAVYAKLTDLEQRVLKLVGVQVATGLAAEEAGLSQRIRNQPRRSVTPPPSPQPTQLDPQVLYSCQPSESPEPSQYVQIHVIEQQQENNIQPWDMPGPSTRAHVAPVEAPVTPQVELENRPTRSETQPPNSSNLRRPVSSPTNIFEEEELQGQGAPSRPVTPRATSRPQPALFGQTTPRRPGPSRIRESGPTTPRHARPTRSRTSPRRRLRPAHTQQAAQHFLNSDLEWRQFRMQQHRDYMENQRESNRIRNMELEIQGGWQTLGARVLDILEKIANKYTSS